MKHSKNWCFCSSKGAGLTASALALLCATACQDDFGGYYNQPSWVSSSSGQVLKARSDCKTYLKLVDKTLFSKQVEGSGQYTFLVPTDEAFDAFFANNPYGYKSVDDIPDDVAARMVSSWMMYNSYPCDTLSNVLSSFNTWSTNEAFKHQTPSYDVLRQETIDGVDYQIYEYPFPSTTFALDNNAPDWNNYRYLPIYTNRYNNNNGITSDDWQKVVGSEFSPYGNYLQAGIIDAGSGASNPGDLFCQNGVIHLVNKVVMPLENMDVLIRTYGDGTAVDEPSEAKQGAWALLRKMLYHKSGNESYCFFSLMENTTAAHYFEKAYPELDMTNFRLRRYDVTNTPFRLNIENYYNMQNAHSSSADCFYTNYNGGMTFYVPEKSVLLKYINERLFRYIGIELTEETTQEEFDAAFNKLSDNVIIALWASMQADGMIWPSQFESSAVNSVGSSEHINGYDDNVKYDNSVLAAGMASNAMWQITNFVPKTSAFEGIASRFLLDPAYSITQDFIDTYYSSTIYGNMLKSKLASMDDVDLTLILWDDANMKWWDNIHYSTLLSTYASGSAGNETSVLSPLMAGIVNGYVERESVDALDLEVDPLNGAYGGWAYTNNYYGGVMRYRKSGKMIDGKPEIQIQTTWSLSNDANEQTVRTDIFANNYSNLPEHLQMTEPTEGSYTSVVKDNSVEYNNGNVYLMTEHSAPLSYPLEGTYGDGQVCPNKSLSALYYLRAYLNADANSANPQHTIFKKYFDYYQNHKSEKANADTIAIGSGYWTIFVPTDEALQYAIDYSKTHQITYQIPATETEKARDTTVAGMVLLRNPDYLPSDPTVNDANWVDSVIYFLNTYITKSGCYPDDGLSAIYEMSEAWDGMLASNRQAATQYLVTTNCVVTDMDRAVTVDGQSKVVKAWDGLISGGRMSGYVAKTDGGKLQYFGRPYTSGAYQVVDVYNSNEMTDVFDNTVVREQGQSNIMAPNCMIHSLNGFIVYKIAGH